MPDFVFTNAQPINGGIVNIVPVGGVFSAPPVWASSDPTIYNPTVAADGLSCSGPVLKAGTITMTVTGNGVSVKKTIQFTALVTGFDVTFVLAPPGPPPAP